MLKKVLLVALALVLLALPFLIRWLYHYEGRYTPGEIPRPDLTGIQAPTAAMESFVDDFVASDAGTILVDLAHGNRLDVAELGVLQSRLAARGQHIELVEQPDSLQTQLRYAKALIVVSPGEDWEPEEVELVQGFVDKGGRLLLVTDPTRFEVRIDERDMAYLDEDVSHMNDLAAQFGILFQGDYLYNTTHNAGNFRNIRLDEFAERDLVQGLEEVVFYAANSIVSEEPALVWTAGETRSSMSERDDDLAVAVLAAGGAVLALGDLTFMTEPYNAAYDNDRLVANIADFLSGVERQYELADFPFFFEEQVDLVYAGDPLLDGDLLSKGSSLQRLFAKEGKELTVRQAEDEATDTLFFGLYREAEEVEPYLTAAQITLHISPTQLLEEPDTEGQSSTRQPDMTDSVLITPTLEIPGTATPGLDIGQGITTSVGISPTVRNFVEIESLGEMVLTGTMLFLYQTDGERQVMVVLADTEEGLENAAERLTEGSLSGCLMRETMAPATTFLALCPTGEATSGDGNGGWKETKPEPPQPKPPSPTATPTVTGTIEPITHTEAPSELLPDSEAEILVIALDEGDGRYAGRTGAEDYVSILGGRFDVAVWSTALKGSPSTLDLMDYDLIIWTGGDFEDAFGDLERQLLFLAMLNGTPVILSGAYIGEVDDTSVQRDIQVEDAGHPMASGFEQGEVIAFAAAPSGREYEIDVLQDVDSQDGEVIFVRGPDSEQFGTPSIFVVDDPAAEIRAAYIGFPLYLLPQEAKTNLVTDTVRWMLQPDD